MQAETINRTDLVSNSLHAIARARSVLKRYILHPTLFDITLLEATMITSAGTDNGASHLESIFHATQLELLLPNASSISRQVGDGNAAAAARRAGGQSSPLEPVTALDLDTLRRSVTREVAFFGMSRPSLMSYFVCRVVTCN